MIAILPAPISTVALAAALYLRWQDAGALLDRAAAALLATQRRLQRRDIEPEERARLRRRLHDLMARHERIALGVDRARTRWIVTRRRV